MTQTVISTSILPAVKEFELWAHKEGFLVEPMRQGADTTEKYKHPHTQLAFKAWQAAVEFFAGSESSNIQPPIKSIKQIGLDVIVATAQDSTIAPDLRLRAAELLVSIDPESLPATSDGREDAIAKCAK